MAAQEQYEVDFTYVVSELGARVRTLENKYNLIGERLLMVNQNMIDEYKKLIKELKIMNSDMHEIKVEMANVKETMNMLVKEMENFASKNQMKVLEKYMDLISPLKFVTEDQVRELIKSKKGE